MNLSPEIEACNECESCQGFNNNHSFNIHELDAASNNGVDKIRELVDQVRFAPQVGKYNIYIIDEVHMLSQAAFNAFLKTLEEPLLMPCLYLLLLKNTKSYQPFYHVVRYLISSAYKLLISLSTWPMWQKMKVLKPSKKPYTSLPKKLMAH